MDTSKIREHMEVIGADGKQLGNVDRVEGDSIKLTRDAEGARGEHRYIPLALVARVDDHVHLNKTCSDARNEWHAHPVKPGEPPRSGAV